MSKIIIPEEIGLEAFPYWVSLLEQDFLAKVVVSPEDGYGKTSTNAWKQIVGRMVNLYSKGNNKAVNVVSKRIDHFVQPTEEG